MAKNNTKQVKIEDVLELSKVDEKSENKVENKTENKQENAEKNMKVEDSSAVSSVSEKTTKKEKAEKTNDASALKVDKKETKQPKTEEKALEEKLSDVSLENKSKNISKKQKSTPKTANNSKKEPQKADKKGMFKKKKEQEPVKPTRVKRVRTDASLGLTDDQVHERINKGQTNNTPNRNVKTYKRIFFENTFTFFNLLCLAVAISLICVGAWSNCLFMAIIDRKSVV